MDYADFIDRKKVTFQDCGKDPKDIHPRLFDFQKAIVKFCVKKGRSAIFADCGLGKTLMQIEWARQIGETTIIFSPLAVTSQTIDEGKTIGVNIIEIVTGDEVVEGRIHITNYEKMHKIDPLKFNAIIIDESSILKSFDGKFRNSIISGFENCQYKLACTATPSPNDYMELGNHCEFLGIMKRQEMLAMFFVHDGERTSQWRIKKHAEDLFWKWVCTWAVYVRNPSEIGFPQQGYDLPELKIITHLIESDTAAEGYLFQMDANTLDERRAARRTSIDARVAHAKSLSNSMKGQCLVWCGFNEESDKITSELDGQQISGSTCDEDRVTILNGFSAGKVKRLVTKVSIAGHGMNWQNCNNMIFLGLSDSFEDYYQAVRRCWRFGQKKPVNVHIVISRSEQLVLKNIERKQKEYNSMADEMALKTMDIINTELHGSQRETSDYEKDFKESDMFKLYLGDCVEETSKIEDDSVGLSVFSPPFASLYTYSNSDRDMGNCKNRDEFAQHFKFLISELYRVTIPGRMCAFHCMNLPTSKTRDGYIGISDFRGELIKAFQDSGWIYHSEVCIWKDPVIAMQRTKALGLLHKQIKKDSCMSRMGIPDYVVTMRKPGDNPFKVSHTPEDFPVSLWQKIASPIWMDINPSDTLQKNSAREEDDERHICLATGSLVLTREHGYLEIEDVEEGDNVLTHQGRWMPVVAKRCNGVRDIVRVCGQGVADLKATPDHKLWARMATGSREKESAKSLDPVWADASTVLGSYLNLRLPPVEQSNLTADEWWIVGRWLGDGHRGTRRTSGSRGAGLGQFLISCAHEEAPALIERLGNYAGHASRVTATQIALINLRKEVREVLDRCGEGASNKRLPGEAVTLEAGLAAELISGYLSADGHYVEKHDRQTASSVSMALLLGMAIIAQRAHGVVASVYAGRPEREGEIEGRRVSMMQDWIFSFRQTDGYKKSGWVDELGAWKKVRKIEDAGESEVWDIQVAEDESFTAEGCIVHNCPLQLEVVRRILHLWSNKGDLVFSPFAGIGSEGYEAIKNSRRFVGIELKRSYWEQAWRNLMAAEKDQGHLFSHTESELHSNLVGSL